MWSKRYQLVTKNERVFKDSFLGAICPTAQQNLGDANGQQLKGVNQQQNGFSRTRNDLRLRPPDSDPQYIISDRCTRSV